MSRSVVTGVVAGVATRVTALAVASVAAVLLAGCQSSPPLATPVACPPLPPPVKCPEPVTPPPGYVPIEQIPAAHTCPPIPECPSTLIRMEAARTPEPKLGEIKMLDGKILVGEAEYATVQPGNLRLDARIDSGATTTSMHATNIKTFERDGQRWVRFTTETGRGDEVTLELPRVRHVRIKGEGDEVEKRPVVMIDVQIGAMRQKIEASLTDRENYNYPLLIGRNFLRDHALIDVGRKYVQGGKTRAPKK